MEIPLLEPGSLNAITRTRHGVMLFNRQDVYIGRMLAEYGEFAQLEIELLSQLCYPGAQVIDIGANVGMHTLALAKLVGPSGRIIAFEAQPIIFQILCANLSLNEITNVRAYPFAVGAERGDIHLPPLDYNRTGNFGGVTLAHEYTGERIPMLCLDEFLPDFAPRLIKIDVEGMEIQVIEVARNLIERHRPFIYIENDRPANSTALIDTIAGMGYRLFWHKPPLFNPNNFNNQAENLFPNLVSDNMICFHRSQEVVMNGFIEIE